MVALLGPALGLLGGVLGLGGSKAATPVQQLPSATRDDAKAKANLNDELLRRKGGAADILTGAKGAEAPSAGLKATLGA